MIIHCTVIMAHQENGHDCLKIKLTKTSNDLTYVFSETVLFVVTVVVYKIIFQEK